jgi:hypothetical protein
MNPMKAKISLTACAFLLALSVGGPALAKEVGKGEVYAVVELAFRGPRQGPADAPARDVDFWVRFRHESGAVEYKVHGFWDGDGRGGVSGDVFKVRFSPTKPGRWTLAEVYSNDKQLHAQRQGDYVTARASKLRGFWVVDDESAGRRWYKRSDGSHQYVIGNTLYSFLSGYKDNNQPTGVDVATDVARNAEYFKKLRFSVMGDRYPHPVEKPFFDDAGNLTASGDNSHRPNPRWFLQRTDVAVQTAFRHDLIADLILAGPDTMDGRSTLRAANNNNDPTPYLKYIAARYGAYPHVWLCLSNEYNIRSLTYPVARIAELGKILRRFLPYAETPLSVHPWSAVLWEFDGTGDWYDHQIIQKKRKTISSAGDFITQVWENKEGGTPRMRPTVNDEMSYQGEGDKHTAEDSIEAALGTFLGGGYSSVGYKPGNKTGHYFWGAFTPEEHTAAPGLKYLRETIDANITFWKMAPGAKIFSGLDAGFRGLAWDGREYALGTNAACEMTAELPPGEWTVEQFDVIARQGTTLSAKASGRFSFKSPASRAVLFHFKKNK